jgi:hypothetical protein
MIGKHLERERIEGIYNFIGKGINYFQTAGTIGGTTFALISLGQPVGEVLVYGGAGTFSYLFGESLNKINGKIREKAIKNLERKAIKDIESRKAA